MAALLAAVVAAATACTAATAAGGQAAHCRPTTYRVTVPGSGPGQLTGDRCVPAHPNGTTLLLVAGGGENADYWNMPGFASYSLVRAAVRSGYTTLALDRLGTGRSSMPRSTAVTYAAHVLTVHQVATALRRQGADRVVGVGHSLGAGVLTGVAARYPKDMTALVLTGYGSAVSAVTPQHNKLYQRPAADVDSAKWGSLDDGYVTVVPSGVPDDGLLYLPGATEAALTAVETHQGTLSRTELATRPQGRAATAQGAALRLPLLLLDGRFDEHYCTVNALHEPPRTGPRCATEQAFGQYGRAFFPHADLTTALVPDAGHALELQTNAPATNDRVLDWISAHPT
ncbi:alpha/beta hydrolase [Actinacidiphila sp. DG2A-62]|uniref:alpha/beta hydrolase n=1 Tax=Actinacidiphila sp. DG2A-62 TaxID=3108821 RepID=UPI002DBA65EF|nr:alpha/beta hydrolase [Actinacidiphila sp. DG2A-62]MEC3992646.1 alpha/beta hydrolase [Actinacidiphila sp. DG2A-62]